MKAVDLVVLGPAVLAQIVEETADWSMKNLPREHAIAMWKHMAQFALRRASETLEQAKSILTDEEIADKRASLVQHQAHLDAPLR